MKLTTPTEKQFMGQVVQLARLLGWKVYHPFDSRRSAAGWPDLFLLRGPFSVAIELKVGKRGLTPEQTEWRAAFMEAGLLHYVFRPADWPEIERLLRGT